MLQRVKIGLLTSAMMVFLASCEQRSEADLLSSITGLTSPDLVQAAIGPADKITKIGKTELWQYDTASKDICFAVAGNTIIRFSCL